MDEPPNGGSKEQPEQPELEVLQGQGRSSPVDVHELSFLAAQVHAASQAQFREDLNVQLEHLRDTSLRPIDKADPRWATMIRVARALVWAGFRIDDCHVGGYQGGACLLQLEGEEGVRVRWSQHGASGFHFADPRHRAVAQIMGDAMRDVLRVLGFTVTPTEHPGNYLAR
jgi:hypothetical protein